MSATIATTGALVVGALDDDAAVLAAPSFSSSDVVDEFVAGPGYGIVSGAFMTDGRLIAGELFGAVHLIDPATGASSKHFTIPDVFQDGEVGILDVAVDPAFATNKFFYVYFTNTARRVEIARFTFSADGAATLATRTRIWLSAATIVNSYHIGGSINFGPDGKLYITIGDNGIGSNSQLLSSEFGKTLRIDLDGTAPSDNPFHDGAGPNVDAIWAYGLRNPYRASFDSGTGDLWVGDVGGNDQPTAYEEIDLVTRGSNYGWPLCEGPLGPPKNGVSCPSGITGPIYSYPHDAAQTGFEPNRAIVGGTVYRGNAYPSSFKGSYVYADYAHGDVFWAERTGSGAVSGLLKQVKTPAVPLNPVWIDVSPVDGQIYWLGLSSNFGTQLRRLRYAGTAQQPPVIQSATATPTSAALGTPMAFTATASDPDGDAVSYSWDFGDLTGSSLQNPTHTYATAGTYQVKLTVRAGADIVNAPPITVQVGNRPVPTIAPPTGGTTFSAGSLLRLDGSATDTEDGPIPAASLQWTVVFRHDNHTHPISSGTGASISVPVTATGHDYSGTTGYLVTLTATDSNGLTGTTTLDLVPDKVLVPVTSNIAVAVTVDGVVRATPTTLDTIVGFQHSLSVPASACIGTTEWTFSNWSNGGARDLALTVPAGLTGLTATYSATGTCGTAATTTTAAATTTTAAATTTTAAATTTTAAATTTTAAATTTTAAVNAALKVSRSKTRSPAVDLNGASITRNEKVYVFLQTTSTPSRVRFYLDGKLERSDTSFPFDYVGGSSSASSWTVKLTRGTHTMRADVTVNGRTVSFTSTFTVV